MNSRIVNYFRQDLGRLAGLVYLTVIVFAGFAEIVRVSLLDEGDAAATADNVLDAEWLFRASIASDLIAFPADVMLALIFFVLLRPVNGSLALLAAFFRLVQAAILGINMLNQFAVLLLLSGDDYLTAFDEAQSQALALFFYEAHGYGYLIGLIFFGFHNIVLGYLVFKSGFLPKVFGILLGVVVSTGYLLDSFASFLWADYPSTLSQIVITPVALTEIAFAVWLLSKGASFRSENWEAPAAS
jgi:hypothetical protein